MLSDHNSIYVHARAITQLVSFSGMPHFLSFSTNWSIGPSAGSLFADQLDLATRSLQPVIRLAYRDRRLHAVGNVYISPVSRTV